jgi:hypothetical protein
LPGRGDAIVPRSQVTLVAELFGRADQFFPLAVFDEQDRMIFFQKISRARPPGPLAFFPDRKSQFIAIASVFVAFETIVFADSYRPFDLTNAGANPRASTSGFHIGRSIENKAPNNESHPIHQTQELPGSALSR